MSGPVKPHTKHCSAHGTQCNLRSSQEVTYRGWTTAGVLVLKYNTVGAKLLKWAAPDTADCIHARDVWRRARVGHVAPGPTSWLSISGHMATMAVDGRQVTVLAI